MPSFTVTERIRQTAYHLDFTGGRYRQALRGIHDIFHVSLLNPYKDNEMAANTPPIAINEHKEYEIEEILYHRQLRNKTQYLVRWRGYDQSEDMYLDELDPSNATDILRSYRAQACLSATVVWTVVKCTWCGKVHVDRA